MHMIDLLQCLFTISEIFMSFGQGFALVTKKQMATGLFGRKNCKMSSKHV